MRVVAVGASAMLIVIATVVGRSARLIGRSARWLTPATWAIAGHFAINTAGNLASNLEVDPPDRVEQAAVVFDILDPSERALVLVGETKCLLDSPGPGEAEDVGPPAVADRVERGERIVHDWRELFGCRDRLRPVSSPVHRDVAQYRHPCVWAERREELGRRLVDVEGLGLPTSSLASPRRADCSTTAPRIAAIPSALFSNRRRVTIVRRVRGPRSCSTPCADRDRSPLLLSLPDSFSCRCC
jgi:hypothetical protein